MANVVNYWDLGSVTTLLSTELNALASSSGLTAGAISSVGGSTGLFNNVYSGGVLGGFPLGKYELELAAPSGAVAGGVFVWFLNSVDGANYEDGSASIIPARPADLIFPLRGVTSTAQRIILDRKPLPTGSFFVLLAQNSGQAFAGTLNTLKVTPVTNQIG